MRRQSLDTYDEFPKEMLAYLRSYGWHFNKRMFEFAVSKMKSREGNKITPIDKEQFEETMNRYSIKLNNDVLYDALYVFHMGRADFYKSSIPDEQHLCMYVKDVVDDVDAYDGVIFNRFYADCIKKGCPIDWEDML